MAQTASKADKMAAKKAVNKAMPLLYSLLKTTAPNDESSFVFEGINFIYTTWLFKQPQLLPYRQHRHACMQILTRHSQIAFIEKDNGFISGVAVDFDNVDNSTVDLLTSICPTDDNVKIISWEKTKQHKMYFKISSIFDLGRLPPFVSMSGLVQSLKANPRFTVEKEQYVQLTDRLLRMSTEEQLRDETIKLLSESPLPLKTLHSKLSEEARTRVATIRSLEHFLGGHQDSFAGENKEVGIVVKNCALAVNPQDLLAGHAADAEPRAGPVLVGLAVEDRLIVERCTDLVLNEEWKTSGHAVCELGWLRARLELGPFRPLSRKQLLKLIKKHPRCFQVHPD